MGYRHVEQNQTLLRPVLKEGIIYFEKEPD